MKQASFYFLKAISFGFLCFSFAYAIDAESDNNFQGFSPNNAEAIYSQSFLLEAGDILYSFGTNQAGTMGVTVVGDKVIVSAGGNSSDAGDNTFYVYNFAGTF